MRITLIAALLLAALPALGQDGMVTLRPAQFGEIFCVARIGNDMGPVTGILSAELTDDIARAQAVNDEWAKANPGDKPPLGDGIPWQSWPDYAPSCTVGDVTESGDSAEVELRYAFPDSTGADFADTLLLKKVATDEFGTMAWRIDNVRYADSGDLRQFLAGISAE
jgi:hypothetical protein